MTKFVLISDLHGNIPVYSEKQDAVLLCPGDIHEVHKINGYTEKVKSLCNTFREVLMVPGNHEYYGTNIERTHNKLQMMSSEIENFVFLQDGLHFIDDVMVIGSTLWTSLSNNDPLTKYDAGRVMNDYRFIRHGPVGYGWKRKLTTDDTMMFHKRSVQFIDKSLDEFIDVKYPEMTKVLVMSHHAPSFRSVSPEFRRSNINGAYCSDLDQLIYDKAPDVWVHGHVHSSFDYMIGDTRVLCNPQGYFLKNGTFENKDFDKNFTFTL